MYILEIRSKWFKIRCSFVTKSQNPKMALCGILIRKLRLFESIDFSWFHIFLAIKQLLKLSFHAKKRHYRCFIIILSTNICLPLKQKYLSFWTYWSFWKENLATWDCKIPLRKCGSPITPNFLFVWLSHQQRFLIDENSRF